MQTTTRASSLLLTHLVEGRYWWPKVPVIGLVEPRGWQDEGRSWCLLLYRKCKEEVYRTNRIYLVLEVEKGHDVGARANILESKQSKIDRI
jgi:hypothetical protein